MNNPQQACASCNEFIAAVNMLKHEAADAKHLPTLKEAQAWICELQVRLGGLETLAQEIKAFTLPAVAAAARHDPGDVIPPPRDVVPAFPSREFQPPPAHYHDGVNA